MLVNCVTKGGWLVVVGMFVKVADFAVDVVVNALGVWVRPMALA